MTTDYVALHYACKYCGTHGTAHAHKKCDPRWQEQLYAMLTCNICADLLQEKSTAIDFLGNVISRLERGIVVTKDGFRPMTADERSKLEATKTVWQRKLAIAAGQLLARHKTQQ